MDRRVLHISALLSHVILARSGPGTESKKDISMLFSPVSFLGDFGFLGRLLCYR